MLSWFYLRPRCRVLVTQVSCWLGWFVFVIVSRYCRSKLLLPWYGLIQQVEPIRPSHKFVWLHDPHLADCYPLLIELSNARAATIACWPTQPRFWKSALFGDGTPHSQGENNAETTNGCFETDNLSISSALGRSYGSKTRRLVRKGPFLRVRCFRYESWRNCVGGNPSLLSEKTAGNDGTRQL